MLPGFRFLFAAIALSVAIPVFGLGVASLFHAAQQDFAGNVAWHSPPEMRWTQPMPAPVLALLQVDPPAARTIAPLTGDNPGHFAAAQPALAASAGSRPANPSSSNSGTPVSNEATSNEVASAASDPAVAPTESKAGAPPLAADPPAALTETVQAPPAPAAETEAAKPLQTAEVESIPASGPTGPVSDADRQAPATVADLTPPSASLPASAPVTTKAAANAKPTAARKPARAKRVARRQRPLVRARTATPVVRPQPFQQASDPFAQPFTQPAAGSRLH